MRIFGPALTLLLLAAAGWTGLWFYASREAGYRVDAWLEAEAAQGRNWTCPDRRITGYPFALALSCDKPTFAGRAMRQSVSGSVAHVTAELAVWHPRRIALTLEPPFAYATSDGQASIEADWANLAIDLDGVPKVGALNIHGESVKVAGQFGTAGRQGGTAKALDAAFALSPQQQDRTLDFGINVAGATIPQVGVLLGQGAPVDIDLSGQLDRADVGAAHSPEEAIDQWRRAGGKVDLAGFRFIRAASKVTASGTLRLDDAHRPQGRLDAQFIGLEPILKRYGISGGFAAAGSLLSSLFGSPNRAPAPPGALSLPVSFQDGKIGIGPIRTQIAVPPLY